MKHKLSALIIFCLFFVSMPKAADAQSLSYSFSASAGTVEAGGSFSINLSLTNSTASSYYNLSVYFYQGHSINETTAVSVVPSYNATYSEPVLSGVYNSGYWTSASIASGASQSYKVTYNVASTAPEGRLQTLGVSPIVAGAPISEAVSNPTSELLIDVVYYTDPTASPESKKTIRNYVDLPSVTQPLSAIASKSFPSVFTQSGSSTTNIALLKKNEAVEYRGFTLDVRNGNKIVWEGPLDLDTDEFLEIISKLDQYVGLTLPAEIAVNTSKVPILDSPATIVFKNVEFVSAPTLLKDDEKVSQAVQNSGICDKSAKICSYGVEGFSEYKLAPTLTVTEVAEVGSANYRMEAFVDDLKATVKYRLNNGVWTVISNIDIDTGRFTADLTLAEGQNTIELTAVSINGETDTLMTEVIYTPGFVEPENDDTPRSSTNVVLIILAVALIVASAVAIVILWLMVYKKRNKQVTKVHAPKDLKTNVLSKEKISSSKIEKLDENDCKQNSDRDRENSE